MSTDSVKQQALISVLGARATNPAGGSNPNRLEPATVSYYAGHPSRMAMVYGDQEGSTPADAFPVMNLTPYPLSIGSKVMVQFYEPKGCVIVGIVQSPLVGFIGDVSQSISDGGGSPTLIHFDPTYDPDGFLTGTGEITVPGGRTGVFSVSLTTFDPLSGLYSRIFTQFVDTGPTPDRPYRSAGGVEVVQSVSQTLTFEAGTVLDFGVFQQSGSAQTLVSHLEMWMVTDDLTNFGS